VDDAVEWEEIPARSFAPGEQRALSALPHGARRAAFFHCWTRKEAVVKALGEGLRRPLSSFVVSVEADCAAMLSCAPEIGTPGSWFLAPVRVPPFHRAAVAVRARATVSMRIWS
jgi:4'-phosphopantetheinyl transferase